MIAPQVPTGRPIGQTVLSDEAHGQLLDATGVEALGECEVSQVGGEVDRIFSLEAIPRDKALQQAKDEAQQRVLDGGAVADSIEIVDVEEVPLAYLPGNATRIRVKAVGTLAVE